MDISNLQVIKASGEKATFSLDRVARSLKRSGAPKDLIDSTLENLKKELYDGITTKEIYNRAFSLLRKGNHTSASKYKLKTAIYELGPTGFPFEKFIAALLNRSGYKTTTGKIYQGKCVTHEIDVEAKTNTKLILIECKFHNAGRNSDVKTPLYINSRILDIKNFRKNTDPKLEFEEAWVVTNTRFTADAIKYAKCSDLKLLKGNKVLELVTKNSNKGKAINFFMNKQPFLNKIPVFIGDDVTDEYGFKSVNNLGGYSIKVGYQSNTLANFFINDTTSVLKFLNFVSFCSKKIRCQSLKLNHLYRGLN